jgi:hypothetical protein
LKDLHRGLKTTRAIPRHPLGDHSDIVRATANFTGMALPVRPRAGWPATLLACATVFACLCHCEEPVYVNGTELDGGLREVDVARTPALYTRDFDDCLGGNSLFNITNFDAAYYTSDSTVLFGLVGNTNVRQDNIISSCCYINARCTRNDTNQLSQSTSQSKRTVRTDST